MGEQYIRDTTSRVNSNSLCCCIVGRMVERTEQGKYANATQPPAAIKEKTHS
jgi:hypothetical protein